VRSPSRGFTLLELLVAVALLALLAASVLGAVRLIARATGPVSTAAIEATYTLAGMDWLGAQLRSALPVEDLDAAAPSGAVRFSGTGDRLRFVVPAPDAFAAYGYVELELISLEDALDARLLAYSPDPSTSAVLHAERLVTGSGARFEYFGRTAPGRDPGWHDRWRGEAGLPARVRIAFTGGGQPELIAAPRAAERGG
jgi:prepilin-type N-terminal cleavage/methylation domain-containing protein